VGNDSSPPAGEIPARGRTDVKITGKWRVVWAASGTGLEASTDELDMNTAGSGGIPVTRTPPGSLHLSWGTNCNRMGKTVRFMESTHVLTVVDGILECTPPRLMGLRPAAIWTAEPSP
jgi:hypothetical protein